MEVDTVDQIMGLASIHSLSEPKQGMCAGVGDKIACWRQKGREGKEAGFTKLVSNRHLKLK